MLLTCSYLSKKKKKMLIRNLNVSVTTMMSLWWHHHQTCYLLNESTKSYNLGIGCSANVDHFVDFFV
jgi:hypothetical protein